MDWFVFSKILFELIERTNGAYCTVKFRENFRENFGKVLTVKHAGYHQNGSLKYPIFKALQKEKDWQQVLADSDEKPIEKELPWRKSPNGYWDDLENCKSYLEWIGPLLGVSQMSDWYKVTNSSMIAVGGQGFLNHFHNSLSQALSTIYPQEKWKNWLFAKAPKKALESEEIKEYLDHLATQLNIQVMDDWYHISENEIATIGSITTINKMGGLGKALSTVYPWHHWDLDKFSNRTKLKQKFLKKRIERLFPGQSNRDYYMNDRCFRRLLAHFGIRFQNAIGHLFARTLFGF